MKLCNLHTHSTFCDGKNTPEQVVTAAIEQGFDSVGFSSHGYTPYDLRYCMKDTEGYRVEINRLKKEYAGKIQIYLGIEEDSRAPVNRSDFDYIIGSCHYFKVGENHMPIDSSAAYFAECVKAYGGDTRRMAEDYFSHFCGYIKERKPDVIGHFDLLTKFDEAETDRFLHDAAYHKMAETYTMEIAREGCLFEVNTGAMARNLRTAPYPAVNLLHLLKEQGGEVILGSDCHDARNLAYAFSETRALLKDIGFSHVRVLFDGAFQKDYL